MTTYTVTKRSEADHDARNDGRYYGGSLIVVTRDDGREVAVYDHKRGHGFAGGGRTLAWILSDDDRRMGIHSVPKDAPQRNVREYFKAQVEARFGVKVGR